jgi:hypothetical protein
VLTSRFAGVPAGARLHISTPRHLEARIRAIPAGRTLDVAELRREIAELNDADATCPATTSMYLWILLELMMDDLAAGADVDEVVPCWRVLGPDSTVARKVDGARELLRKRRFAEGIDAG